MNNQHNNGSPVSSFDQDFGNQNFAPVEETVVIDGKIVSQLLNRRPPGDPDFAEIHRLHVIDPNGEEWEYPIEGQITLGRAEDNQISLPDRAVSRQHLAINTDGQFYWFQDLGSGNGTQVNGEYVEQGWLTGGEEIVIGNSYIYFLLPDAAVPPEFADENQVLDGEGSDVVLAHSESNGEGPILAPIKEKEPSEGGHFIVLLVLLIGLAGTGLVGWWVYKKVYKKPITVAVKTNDKKDEPAEKQALHLFEQSKEFMKKGQWSQADQSCRKALTLLPNSDPMRPTILRYCTQAGQEVIAQHWYKQAVAAYDKDKPGEAVRFARRIRKEHKAYVKAQKLINKIRRKELGHRIKMARLYIESKRAVDALKTLNEILAIDPTYPEGIRLKKMLEGGGGLSAKAGDSGSRKMRDDVIPAQFAAGKDYYCLAKYADAIIYFRQQESGATTARLREIARMYRIRVQDFERALNRGIRYARRRKRRAISNLRQAKTIDTRYFKGCLKSRYNRWLSRMYYRRSRRSYRRKKYVRASRLIRKARVLNRTSPRIKKVSQAIRTKAKRLINEAKILIGADNNEARSYLRKAMGMIPSTDPLYKKAKRYLSQAQ